MSYRKIILLIFVITSCISTSVAQPQKKPIRPNTVKQAVEIIKTQWLSQEDLDWILRNPKDQVSAQLHHGLGTQIRNKFGLWSDNAALRKDCGEEHPDDCSGVIISELWKSIRSDNDPELVKKLDIQFKLMSEIMIDYKGFCDFKTGEWLSSLTSQIQAQLRKNNQNSPTLISLTIRVLGDPDMNAFTRAEFSEDGKGPSSLDTFLGWFSWRNAFVVRHNPPYIEFSFNKKCAWPKRPEGILYQPSTE